jgi:hypothetical protein
VPAALKVGDIIQMLNIGGVMGVCDSATPDKGKPFDLKVLGVVLNFPYLGERIGVPARVGYRPLAADAPLDTRGIPVVALAGTCMEAGKTAAAAAIIARMRHRGLVVDAIKATGVSLRRDILAFEDAGARKTMIFTDLGVVTTSPRSGPALTRTMLTELAHGKPDVIVFELGDGLLGTYGWMRSSIARCASGTRAWCSRPRSGCRLGRRRSCCAALPRRARLRHRSIDRQPGRRRHHPPADTGRRLNAMSHPAALGDA